jgi:hypothetical protein
MVLALSSTRDPWRKVKNEGAVGHAAACREAVSLYLHAGFVSAEREREVLPDEEPSLILHLLRLRFERDLGPSRDLMVSRAGALMFVEALLRRSEGCEEPQRKP